MDTREFDLGDVLSVTTGKLVSPRHIQGVYDILDFLFSTNFWTHELPAACAAARPVLIAQYPDLAGVDATSVDADNWRDWLDQQKAALGATRMVTAIEGHNQFSAQYPGARALQGAIDLAGEEKVIVAVV